MSETTHIHVLDRAFFSFFPILSFPFLHLSLGGQISRRHPMSIQLFAHVEADERRELARRAAGERLGSRRE
jgi:hypothetical protein